MVDSVETSSSRALGLRIELGGIRMSLGESLGMRVNIASEVRV